jgi:DNA repair protein RadD
MPLILRDYQEEAIQAIYDYWDKEKGKNPLCVAPTGSGKAVIVAELCRHTCTEWPGVRILVITHTREIISQN